MKITSPLLNQFGGLLGAAAVRWWMGTLDYKVAYYDRAIDPVFPECRGQKIYIFWHEYILFPLYLRGHCNLAMLLSRHRDAEMLSYAAHHLGFEFVRGSTNRGGVGALRGMLDRSRSMHLTITPDGPRGPRRRLAPGCVYLASKLGLPLVLMGFGYDRPWRVHRAWDQFAVPRPCSRARAIVSGEIFVPPDLDREGLEHFRGRIEVLLNRLTTEAEAWAASGRRKIGQSKLDRRPAPLRTATGRHPFVHRFRALHEQMAPRARTQGIVSDQDVFDCVS
jgi:lysophospholipid acyltransferase (LPLAT)-like uncharacterized protein